MGLNHEQNIMLTPGYTKDQVENRVNIFSDYPYTSYDADKGYYRSSDEDTYLRDLVSDDNLIQEIVDARVESDDDMAAVCISTENR